MKPIKVVVLGSGNIGTDLAVRLSQDRRFELLALIGRREESPGLIYAGAKGLSVAASGFSWVVDNPDKFDVFFDATSAQDHIRHWEFLRSTKKLIIDLTPSRIGMPMVPILANKDERFRTLVTSNKAVNYSMVTCGGQSSAGIVDAFQRASKSIDEVEVSSSIAAKSAGLATRRNLDNYIDATEGLVSAISKCKSSKAILVLNPALPEVMMRTTVTVKSNAMDLDMAKQLLKQNESAMQAFVPGFHIATEPYAREMGVFSASATIEGAGYYLPTFAGNLDVINAAAVETAAVHYGNRRGHLC